MGGVEVALSLKESKVPLEKTQLTQFMEASLKILKAMITEDGLNTSSILDYINYLIKFATFAQSFKWDSLLRYDYEYRKSQADVGFVWGSDSPYLMQLHLMSVNVHRDRDFIANKKQKSQKTSKNKYDPSSGKPVCKKFNSPAGCDFKHCKFAHVCQSCYGSHVDCSPKPASENNSING